MKKILVYVDTSVIGGCCDPEFQIWSNGILSDFQAGNFALLLSELTDAEIQDAPDEVKDIYREFVNYADDIIELSPEAIKLWPFVVYFFIPLFTTKITKKNITSCPSCSSW